MKSFRPLNIVPIRINTSTMDPDPPEIVALKHEINDKLHEIMDKTNDALRSVTENTLDMGLWASGEVLDVYGKDSADDQQDLAVRHHLAVRPRYWVVIDQINSNAATAADTGAQQILRGTTPWTDTHVFFRVPTACKNPAISGTTFKVLLIP